MSQTSRPVAQVITPEPVVEGAGVHLRRSIGTRRLDHLDPFLLLDHFESARPADYEAGFPYHPHRGIETVTLVRARRDPAPRFARPPAGPSAPATSSG